LAKRATDKFKKHILLTLTITKGRAVHVSEKVRCLVVLPCYNEEENIADVYQQVKETFSPRKGLTSQMIIEELNKHMSDEMIAVADVGDCLFSCLDLRVNRFIAPAFYASMGFGVPAGIGVALADPTRRPIVLVGDGAFQMTGVELCTARKLEQNPLVIVFNDGYYGTLRAFSPEMKSLELPRWDYAGLARSLGCDGGSASTPEELRDLLCSGLESKLPYVVDARITGPPSPLLQRLGELISKKTKGSTA